MSGIISVIIWIVIMAAVSGVLKGRNNSSGTKDQNPYNNNGTTVPPQNSWNNGNAGQQSRSSSSVSTMQPGHTAQPGNAGQPNRAAGPVSTGQQSYAAYTDYSAGTVQDKRKHGTFKGGQQSPQTSRTSQSPQATQTSQVSGKPADMSTTDYLRQKAVLDEADHMQDRQQEEMRARWETGGLPSARRLYEGDSVPQGMRVIKCSYCGAENLVPQGSRQKYTCYFCREEL